MLTDEFQNRLLAVLFAAAEPVTPNQLVEVFPDVGLEGIGTGLAALADRFNSWQQALEIQRVAGGYRIVTRPVYHEVIRDYLKTKPSAKLSQAALETLAVIAYRQPVTLPEIMEIRGIKGTSTIRTLLEKKLIEMKGRKKVVGRPILYGTTQEFLIHFGLDDLSELPSLEEFEELLASDAGAGVGEPRLSEE
jgi:segregation and condensation protein B